MKKLAAVAVISVAFLAGCAGSSPTAPDSIASTVAPTPTPKFTASAATICAQLAGTETTSGPLEDYLTLFYASNTRTLTQEDKVNGRALRADGREIATRAEPAFQSTIEAVFSDEENEHKAALIEIVHTCEGFNVEEALKQP